MKNQINLRKLVPVTGCLTEDGTHGLQQILTVIYKTTNWQN